MHYLVRRVVGLIILVGFCDTALAQDGSETDSLRTYDLNEIVVSDESNRAPEILTVQRIRTADLAQLNAATTDDYIRLIPSAHLQTNSRGESLVYLRNAGERQVAVFLDGALLNIPWDNRVDLSLVPSTMIESISVSKGASSVLYGTNVLGGAVNLMSRQLSSRVTEVSAEISDPRSAKLQLNHLGSIDKLDYAVSAGYFNSSGMALSSDAKLPFSQAGSSLRSNTDRELINVFSRLSIPTSEVSTVSVTALHYSGEKGVAPEGHLDPAESRVRYWQLPTLKNTILIGNYARNSSGLTVRATAWMSQFEQTINQFDDFSYANLSDTQDDLDRTIGVRIIGSQDLGPGVAKISLNGLTSSHEQIDSTVGELPFTQDYRQNLFSLGGEYGLDVTPLSAFTMGASIDGYSTPKTGDKPGRDPDLSYSLMAGATHQITRELTVRLATGRKLRFPTSRELFGESLGRFLVNDDLRPESSLMAEVGIAYSSESFSAEVIPFISRTFDTIDRRNVEIDGSVFRQRVNLDGSRVFGVEAVAVSELSRFVHISGNATWTNSRVLNADDGSKYLVEKPNVLANVGAEFRGLSNLRFLVRTTYTGKALSLDETNDFVQLPTSVVFGMRVSFLQTINSLQGGVEFYLRADNITDQLVLPQLGLPAAGRAISAGLSLTL